MFPDLVTVEGEPPGEPPEFEHPRPMLSFPRRRESIRIDPASILMDPRLRGDDRYGSDRILRQSLQVAISMRRQAPLGPALPGMAV